MWQTWQRRTLLGGSLALAMTGLLPNVVTARADPAPPLEPPAAIAPQPDAEPEGPLPPAER